MPNFRIDASLGAGTAEHRTDGSDLDGDTSAAFFRLRFEGVSDRGFGGGVRLESWRAKDDIFHDNGYEDTDVTSSGLFGHFTYRFEQDEFSMPLRAGLLLYGHRLEGADSGDEVTSSSLGPMFEIAPEIVLAESGDFRFSLFGELGFGFASTVVNADTQTIDDEDFDSSTWFYGLELGARFYFGHFETGLSFVARGLEMDESDPEGGQVIQGYEASFDGLLLTFGAVF